MNSLSTIPEEQSNYFRVHLKSYPSLEFRLERLKKLEHMIQKNESRIIDALRADLDRPRFEALVGEIFPILREIQFAKKNLKTWMKPQKLRNPNLSAAHFRSKAYVFPQPRGVSLIIGPWNYPFQLLLSPLVGSISAGNTAVLKASEQSPNSSALLKELIQEYFEASYIHLVEGDAEVARKLLEKKFDFIFFTGSSKVGQEVMEAAAKNLSPLVLELGGKCPAILDRRLSRQETALRRILWGKLFNAGQTCVSPDFLLVPKESLDEVLENLKTLIKRHYSDEKSYGRIINQRHFDRLENLLRNSRIVFGGRTDSSKLWIEPSLAIVQSPHESLMKEEIFGPILPVVPYDSKEEVFDWIEIGGKPLALYVFSKDPLWCREIERRTQSGAFVQNDVVVHLSHPELPFGGVGSSGFGHYHGFYGFKSFSHWKAVEKRELAFDFSLRYPPYPSNISKFWRRFL